MPKGIIVAAVLVFALMLAAKDGRLPRKAGLTGSCFVAQQESDGGQLVACRAGVLEGRPDLSHRSCLAAGATGRYAYWRCPTAQAAGP
jgi:hypothetical protein